MNGDPKVADVFSYVHNIRKLSRCFWDVLEFHTIGIKNVQSRHVIYTCKEKLFSRCSIKDIRKHDLRVVQSSSTPIFRRSKNHFSRLVFSSSSFFFFFFFTIHSV